MTLSSRARLLVALSAFAVLAAVSIVYVLHAARRDETVVTASDPTGATTGAVARSGAAAPGSPAVAAAPLSLSGTGQLLFIDNTPGPHYGVLAAVPLTDPAAPRELSNVVCLRVYAAAGHVLCVRASNGFPGQYEADILNSRLHTVRTIPVAGLPSRARISRDGRIASWTVFVYGDSYVSIGFSTRTSILDLRTGALIGSLESFDVIKDGKPYRSSDDNFWGVTVAADDNTFYATMATHGVTYLVRGDLRARTLTTLTTNVECPSLSPDGTRIAFKERVRRPDGRPWQLDVLDLATLKRTALAEPHSVDDQAAWLDNTTVAYNLPQTQISAFDLWEVPADGSGHARMLVGYAASPTPLAG